MCGIVERVIGCVFSKLTQKKIYIYIYMFENLFLKFVFQTSKTVFLRHISTKQPTDNKSTTAPTTNQSYPLEFHSNPTKKTQQQVKIKKFFIIYKKIK